MPAEQKQEYHVILDLETTGLPHDPHARAIAYALLVVRDSDHEPVYTDKGYIKPAVWSPLASKAEAIHHISEDTVRTKGYTESEVAEYFRAIDTKYGAPRWTSYNKRFELEMLARLGFTPKREGRCIMELASEKLRLKKRTVALRVSYPQICGNIEGAPPWSEAKAHDAGYDVLCAYLIHKASVPCDLPF